MTLSLSFSGGGWIGICYYYGTIKYLVENNLLQQDIITLGASAGSWAATLVLYIQYKLYIKKQKYNLQKLKKNINSFFNSLKEQYIMHKDKITTFFKKIIPRDKQFINFIKNKLYISISKNKILYLQNILINPKSYNDLIEKLVQSSMIPLFIDLQFDYLDGGLTNNQPIYNKDTIKINCIYKHNADIYPKQFVNIIYMFKIPPITIRTKLNKMGYNNIRNYFEADF